MLYHLIYTRGQIPLEHLYTLVLWLSVSADKKKATLIFRNTILSYFVKKYFKSAKNFKVVDRQGEHRRYALELQLFYSNNNKYKGKQFNIYNQEVRNKVHSFLKENRGPTQENVKFFVPPKRINPNSFTFEELLNIDLLK